MNQQPAHEPNTDPPCNTILYRTIRRKDWFDPDEDTRVKAEAFMRRAPRIGGDGIVDRMDEDGLSVFDSIHIGMDQCIEESLSCYGVATLHVGSLRDCGLTVVRDPDDYRKVLITDLPFENPNNAEKECLLDRVADAARIGVKRRHKRSH